MQAPKGFNIDNFMNSFADKTGNGTLVASPAYFEAYFADTPNCFDRMRADLRDRQMNTFRNMRFRASNADLPSRQMVSVQRAFTGPHKLVPYSSIYASSIIEFIETPRYDIRAFFDSWQDLIEGNQRGFETEYYEDLIAKEFIIKAYNREGQAVQKWTLYNVFPVSVNPSQMNWGTQSSIVTAAVELSYHRWKFEALV